MSFQILEATISTIHEAMRQGRLTSAELIQMYMERIHKFDQAGPCINSIITLNPNALEEARKKDRIFMESGLAGPLHGIPVMMKDNIQTFDLPTTAGCKALNGYIPGQDAFITRKLKDAGAIILAKTNLSEFAFSGETVSSLTGQTRNPYDLTRTPGGSSGGTGAAIACSFGVVGVGTDTVNSVRTPSSACSLCGIRPTMGLVSRNGIVPYSLSHDTAGPLCRTVEDSARTLSVIRGYDPADPVTAGCVGYDSVSYENCLKKDGLKGKSIGVLEAFIGNGACHQEVNRLFDEAVRQLAKEGAFIIRLKDSLDLNWLINDVGVQALELKEHLDAIAYPHQSQLVCKIGNTQQQRNGALGMVTGFPSIVVPAGYSSPCEDAPIGVPVGIEFLGRPWRETTLIEIGYALEQALKARRPPVSTKD